jgi:KUP system potassium uptake protein
MVKSWKLAVIDAVVIISTVILICLFVVQRFGTHRVSIFFSPIMLAWFLSNATIGVYNIAAYYPGVLKAVSPHYIPLFLIRHGKSGWLMLGAVILCITGTKFV